MRYLFGALLLLLSLSFSSVFAVNNDNQVLTQCGAVKSLLQSSLDLPLQFKTNNTVSQNLCSVIAQGSGSRFEKNSNNFGTLVSKVRTALLSHGWRATKETSKYDADAPFATIFTLSKDDLLAIARITVSANLDNCLPDQPLDLYSNCSLTPSERHYLVKVTVVKNA